MLDDSTFRGRGSFPSGRPQCSNLWRAVERLNTPTVRSFLRNFVRVGSLVATVLLLCQCHRQTPKPAPTPAPTPTAAITAMPSATAAVTPTATATPTPSPTPLPLPTVSSTPDPFADGIERLLNASEKGFLEMRGKFKKTEDGSGKNPLFRVRKLYEGTFLFGGAVSRGT